MPGLTFSTIHDTQWSDQIAYVGGARCTKIEAVSFGVSRPLEELFGEGDEPIQLNEGNRKYSGSITLLKQAYDELNDAAIAAGGRDILDLELDIVIVYKAKGARRMRTMTMVGVKFGDVKLDWKQGDTKMEVPLPVQFLRLLAA